MEFLFHLLGAAAFWMYLGLSNSPISWACLFVYLLLFFVFKLIRLGLKKTTAIGQAINKGGGNIPDGYLNKLEDEARKIFESSRRA